MRMTVVPHLLIVAATLVSADSGPFLVADLATADSVTEDAILVDLYTTSEGVVYFIASDGMHGFELWRSDGSSSGTWLVSDIYPGPISSKLQLLTEAQGQMLFTAAEASPCSWPARLWHTNGYHHSTAPGPALIGHSTCPSIDWPDSTVLDVVATSKGQLFFSQWTQELGEELWILDSPTAEPRVIDLCQGSCESQPYEWVAFGDLALFLTDSDGEFDGGLWVSDGAETGTLRLRSFPGEGYASLKYGAQLVGSYLYCEKARSTGSTGLWRTDGTPTGTYLILDLGYQGPALNAFTLVGEVAFFSGSSSNAGAQVWVTDGTAEGTSLLDHFSMPFATFPRFTRSGDSVLFTLLTGGWQSPVQLWRSDGSSMGTTMVATLDSIRAVVSLEDSAVLAVRQGSVTGIWSSDGTPDGTYLIKELGSKQVQGMSSLGKSAVFFTTEGRSDEPLELWRTDGTASGTEVVKVIRAPNRSASPQNLIPFQERVIFNASEDSGCIGLWQSDGSPEGTLPIATGLQLEEHATVGNRLFLQVLEAGAERQLLVLESNAVEPLRLAQFRWGGDLEVVGEDLYMIIEDDSDAELWRSDGTPQGTGPIIVQLSCIAHLSRLGDQLYLAGSASEGTALFRLENEQIVKIAELPIGCHRTLFDMEATDHGLCIIDRSTVWWSDGTAVGTAILDASFDGFYYLSELTPAGRTMFLLKNGSQGSELWKASEDGLSLIHDLKVAGQSGLATDLVAGDGRVFFGLYHTTTGSELWVSDGTTEGTKMVRDIYPGPRGSIPSALAVINGTLVFAADDGVSGQELWISDGSQAGTRLVADIAFGRMAAGPQMFTLAGALVFFSADDGTSGRELWAIPQSAVTGQDLFTRRPRGRRRRGS